MLRLFVLDCNRFKLLLHSWPHIFHNTRWTLEINNFGHIHLRRRKKTSQYFTKNKLSIPNKMSLFRHISIYFSVEIIDIMFKNGVSLLLGNNIFLVSVKLLWFYHY